MEEGKGELYLASGRQYGNALLGVRKQEEEEEDVQSYKLHVSRTVAKIIRQFHNRVSSALVQEQTYL